MLDSGPEILLAYEGGVLRTRSSWMSTTARSRIAGHNVTVVKVTHSPESGYDILVPTEGVTDV
jgi:hypothetical protein